MRKTILLAVLLTFLMTTACNVIPAVKVDLIQLGPTETPSPAPTSTPLPSPTPEPTPLPHVRIDLARESLFAGDLDTALADLQTALAGASDVDTKTEALSGIGRVQYLKKQYDPALKSLQQAVDANPQSSQAAVAHFLRGECYSELTLWQEAADSYAAYLTIRPGILDAHVQELRGDALLNAGNPQDALVAYQTAAQAQQLGDPVYLEVKVGQAYAALGDDTNALRTFMGIYEKSSSDYFKAQMNLLAGQAYLRMELPDQAYARFQDSVNNYPQFYDSYNALVELVNAGISVDELNRGLTDYYAQQYGVAVEAFNRHMASKPDHEGTAHYFKAMSLRAMDDLAGAVAEWNALIADHAGDKYYSAAWDEKAFTQWAYLEEFPQAAQTLLDFVALYPDASATPAFLFDAARIQERDGRLTEAAANWERLINEYAAYEDSYQGLFLAGVTRYRLKTYDEALLTFQRLLVLNSNPVDQSVALFWIGKSYQAKNDIENAKSAWEQAAAADPTGYYSERAREILSGLKAFEVFNPIQYEVNLEQERHLAELWLRTNFTIPEDTDLDSLGALLSDPRLQRGDEFWSLGLYAEASKEFEALRQDLQNDAAALFRLVNHLVDLGLNRSAIFASRQILNLAGLGDEDTFTAPNYFNHIRFGLYFNDLVVSSAEEEDFHPLFLFSIIRQESMFEGFVYSSAGARGLMQIMPATGQEIAETMRWPSDYSTDDLFRPMVNIRLGARYLARQRDYFDGDLYTMLAAYNAGPGNAQYWLDLAPDDPDLFLEVIRYEETRRYIKNIAEFMNLYRRLYEVSPH